MGVQEKAWFDVGLGSVLRRRFGGFLAMSRSKVESECGLLTRALGGTARNSSMRSVSGTGSIMMACRALHAGSLRDGGWPLKQPCCASAWSESLLVEIRQRLMREDAACGTRECCWVCRWKCLLSYVGGRPRDIKIQRWWRELRYQVGGYEAARLEQRRRLAERHGWAELAQRSRRDGVACRRSVKNSAQRSELAGVEVEVAEAEFSGATPCAFKQEPPTFLSPETRV